MKTKSFEIALSAIACAFASVFLVLGTYIGILMATGYVFGVFAMMLPLSKKFYLGGFLSYVATVLITLFLGAGLAEFWRIFPFIAFLGLHPLVNALQQRFKINRYVALAVKAVWFDGMLVAFYALFVAYTGGSVEDYEILAKIQPYIYYVLIGGGTLFLIMYDFCIFRCQLVIDRYVERIRPTRTKSEAVNKTDKVGDVFSQFDASDDKFDGYVNTTTESQNARLKADADAVNDSNDDKQDGDKQDGGFDN